LSGVAEAEVSQDEPVASEGAQYDFDPGFQRKIASMFLRDTTFALKTKDLIKPEYFTEQAVGALVRLTQEHLKVYKSVPDVRIIPTLLKDEIAKKRVRTDILDDIKVVIREAIRTDLTNPGFVTDKVADFAKHQAIEQAILASVPLLEKGEFDKIAGLMKEATAVGTKTDGDDYDYWKEIASRTKKREDFNAGRIIKDGITTGYSGIDAYLYHNGWGRRELSCIMGPAKAGKSMSLGDFGKNASLAGYNVFYDSCEVAKEIIAERTDASLADVIMRDLHKNPADVQRLIQAAEARAGEYRMRDHPSGTLKPSQLHRLIDNYRSDGIIFDLVIVDYADIMAAEYRSDSLQENLRSIYIDLRAIGHEFNCAMLTATQTNRDGAKAVTAKATDVGDDWNKARTVDILIGINATEEEKKAGEARLYWALSRNTEDGFQLRIKQDRQKMQFIKSILGRVT